MPRQLLGLHVLAGTVPARSMRHYSWSEAIQFPDPKRTSGECRENQEIIALGVSDLIHVKAGRQPGHYAARQKEKRGCHVGLELLANASFLLRPTIHDRLLGLHDHDDVGDARSSILG